MRDWYDPPATPAESEQPDIEVKWGDIISNWLAVALDLHERFGIDVDSGVLHQRNWFWLHDRILDLLDSPSRLRRALELPADYTRT